MARWMFFLTVALLVVVPIVAAEPERPNAPATDANAAGPGSLNSADPKLRGSGVRASKLMGMSVFNDKGEKIGRVDDIVLDAEKGKIRYAALSFGGFLGLGDKLFAIPWNSFRYTTNREGEYSLFLGVDEATLRNAPGFDEDAWPDFANQELTKAIDQHYDTQRDTTN